MIYGFKPVILVEKGKKTTNIAGGYKTEDFYCLLTTIYIIV